MSDRYELAEHLDRLRSALAKAERQLPLDQPIRSSDLYARAVHTVDELIADVETVLEQNARDRQ